LLCPSWLFVRAIGIIKDHFCKKQLTKKELHQRYSKYWLSLLRKGFPNLVLPTHVLFRRFYAKYSFLYFAEDFPNAGVIGENSFITWVLGHSSVEVALSYTNLQLRNAGKMKLFHTGRRLEVPALTHEKTAPSVSSKKALLLAASPLKPKIKRESKQ
jgi:hypothetical protein